MDERWIPQYRLTRRSPSPQLRIGHAERERMAQELKEHTHAGRLDLHEFEERVEKAYAAKTAGDLAALTVDLPPLLPVEPPAARQPAAGRFRHQAAMGALSSYLVFSMMMIFLWAASGAGFFWPIWVIGPWGVMLLRSLLVGRLSRRRWRRPTWY